MCGQGARNTQVLQGKQDSGPEWPCHFFSRGHQNAWQPVGFGWVPDEKDKVTYLQLNFSSKDYSAADFEEQQQQKKIIWTTTWKVLVSKK